MFRAERKFKSTVCSRKEKRLIRWDRERGPEAGQASPRGLGRPCGFCPDPGRCLGAAAAVVASSLRSLPHPSDVGCPLGHRAGAAPPKRIFSKPIRAAATLNS